MIHHHAHLALGSWSFFAFQLVIFFLEFLAQFHGLVALIHQPVQTNVELGIQLVQALDFGVCGCQCVVRFQQLVQGIEVCLHCQFIGLQFIFVGRFAHR